jgi:carbamoyl-phosphate synthase large subunit
MTRSQNLKIVIASAGHRAHYLDWFRTALRSQGLPGEVIALEYRESAPSFASADRGVVVPAYNAPVYRETIANWVSRESPDLLISLNDYELQVLSTGLADELRRTGCIVAALESGAQTIVLDKHLMASALTQRGLPSPATWLGSEVDSVRAANPNGRFIVKHRFGSGSTGLCFASAADLGDAVSESAKFAKGGDGRASSNGLDAVVVQELLPGAEYGVDGVYSLDGEGSLLGVLARRKDRMRGGDTDVATTVAPGVFTASMAALGDLLKPVGPIDVDFRESADGTPLIIDVNPRFGGGYPFCHLAGADLPAHMVRSLAELDHDPSLLSCRIGIMSARREEFSILDSAPTLCPTAPEPHPFRSSAPEPQAF